MNKLQIIKIVFSILLIVLIFLILFKTKTNITPEPQYSQIANDERPIESPTPIFYPSNGGGEK